MIKNEIVELIMNDETDDLGVNIISLVDGPAIGVEWITLSSNDIHSMIVEMASNELIGEVYDPEKVLYVDLTKEQFSTIKDYLKGVLAFDILGRMGIKKEQKPELRYKYTGPPAERNFCKAMLRLNKIYTKEEIDDMSKKIDTGFRHKKQPYSLFDFKGGVRCKHYWEELSVFKNEDGTMVFVSHGRAKGKAGEVASSSNNFWRYPLSNKFSAIDSDKRIVVGPVMIPDLPIKRIDEFGNEYFVYFTKDTVNMASEKFFKTLKVNNTDIQHNEDITNENTLLESWIVEDLEKDKSLIYGFNVPVGTWMAKYKINNEETWQQIKNNELNGFSIDGNFIKQKI